MSDAADLPPVRVERALRLLPELEALAPLRALLVSVARPDQGAVWASSGPYLTLGARGVQPDDVRRQMPQTLRGITEHLEALYAAYLEALESHQHGEGGGAVGALLKAGRLEEGVGQPAEARAWYQVALGLAEALHDRQPELQSLRALGRLCVALGRHVEAARHFQRSLALAEAEFDQAEAVAACQGLGDVSLAQGQLAGAQAWYERGLRLAEASSDPRQVGRVELQLGVLTLEQGNLAGAGAHVLRAREYFESTGATDEMVRALTVQGRLEARLGRLTAAFAAYREALAWMRRGPPDGSLEVAVRVDLAKLHLLAERWLEAEEEMRRAEQLAIAGNLTRLLVEVYALMGKVRGLQADETGFVFFEQAIELCRYLERSPAAKAQVYAEYGFFRERLGQREEARAYFERALEIFESLGNSAERERLDAELQKMSAVSGS